MKYTKIPTNTFQELQLNAGIVATEFTPASGAISDSNIIGATSGGIQFSAKPTFKDNGDGIDNCPKNMKELKQLESWEATMSGTFVSVNAALTKKLIGAADVSSGKITPRNDLTAEDFGDIWLIGDYSDKNGDKNGGFVAIHLMNALSTDGFSMKTADKDKGQFAFSFTGHYSMSAQDTVPFEVYIKSGAAEG